MFPFWIYYILYKSKFLAIIIFSLDIYILKDFPITELPNKEFFHPFLDEIKINQEYITALTSLHSWCKFHFIFWLSYSNAGFFYGPVNTIFFSQLNEILRFNPILVFDLKFSSFCWVLAMFPKTISTLLIFQSSISFPEGSLVNFFVFMFLDYIHIIFLDFMRYLILLACWIYFFLQLPYHEIYYRKLYRYIFRILKRLCKILRKFKFYIYLHFLIFPVNLYTLLIVILDILILIIYTLY